MVDQDNDLVTPEGSVLRQLRRHSVALISLVVALTSLGYNTWRNETSEPTTECSGSGLQDPGSIGRLRTSGLDYGI